MLRHLTVAAITLTAVAAGVAPAQANPEPKAPKEFVALSDIDPTIIQDMRYATPRNFVGKPIDGYRQPICILTETAAKALHRAQQSLLKRGYSLKVYDCYRPQRAVDHFVRWAKDLDDQRMKQEYYPNVDKSNLFADGYIAEKSGHSRGSTVDLTLVKLPAQPTQADTSGPCYASQRDRTPTTPWTWAPVLTASTRSRTPITRGSRIPSAPTAIYSAAPSRRPASPTSPRNGGTSPTSPSGSRPRTSTSPSRVAH